MIRASVPRALTPVSQIAENCRRKPNATFWHGLMKDGEVLNKDTIMKVQMPNRDGFINLCPGKF